MNNFNDLINLFWSCLWIVGCVSTLLITLILRDGCFLVNPHIEGILVVIRRRWMLLCFHLLQAVVMPEKIEELNSI
ncbi:hypothetical protein PDQ31_18260 [Bacillus cereus]|uniref:hypothetical protein n=1 Tax=Bacillus cereus group sp. MYBK34-1 TaxID=3450631 RepID=UPI003F79D353|nr:hypothetical protein [Bacillus cereus]